MGASPSFPVISLPRSKVVVVTGGNTGIGYEAAKQIAMMGASVIIACRSEQRATDAISRMNEEYLQAKSAGKLQEGHIKEDSLPVEFMKLDLGSLKSTQQFIQDFKSSGRKLHLLLCNAGVGLIPRTITDDGFEKYFQVNYLGHFLIVSCLLPIMKQSGDDCRIVFTSSSGHTYSPFSMENMQAEDETKYDMMKYYGKSKLYQVMHMYSLARLLKGTSVTVTSFHPGFVETNMSTDFEAKTWIQYLVKCYGCCCRCGVRSPLQGATTLIDAAVNPRKKGMTGVYLVDCQPQETARDARNETYQEQLWNYSIKCLEKELPEDIKRSLQAPN